MIERPLSRYYLAKMGRVAKYKGLAHSTERAQLEAFLKALKQIEPELAQLIYLRWFKYAEYQQKEHFSPFDNTIGGRVSGKGATMETLCPILGKSLSQLRAEHKRACIALNNELFGKEGKHD